LGKDGLVVAHTKGCLFFSRTLIQELSASTPSHADVGVPVEAPLVLDFALPIDPADLPTLTSFIEIEEDGAMGLQSLPFTAALDADDARRVVLTPDQTLEPGTPHRIVFTGDPGTLRSTGLFDRTLVFETATAQAEPPELVSIAPRALPAQGGQLTVGVRDADEPRFTIYGSTPVLPSSVTEPVDGVTTYVLDIPAGVSGAASLEVINDNGARDVRLGAFVFLEPIRLDAIEPEIGGLGGWTQVALRGDGFPSGAGNLVVRFGTTTVSSEDVRVVSPELAYVFSPPGALGTVDVEATSQLTGQSSVLPDAFTYVQPVTEFSGRPIFDMHVDPTGTYLIAVDGEDAFVLNLTTGEVVSEVEVPGKALGIDSYFERGADRLLITGSSGGEGLFYAVDLDDFDLSKYTTLSELKLPGSFARGITAGGNKAAVAMGEAGVGWIDTHLIDKTYLAQRLELSSGHAALDVEQMPNAPGAPEHYLVASGDYDKSTNNLLRASDPSAGSFVVVRRDAAMGAVEISSLSIPALRIAQRDGYAYLAAGEAGLIVVDVRDVFAPKVVRRMTTLGAIQDVEVKGTLLYAASSTRGVLLLDTSDPADPIVQREIRASEGQPIRAVASTLFHAIGGTQSHGEDRVSHGEDVIVFAEDPNLSITAVSPSSRIIDADATGDELVTIRFNKSILGCFDNSGFVKVYVNGASTPLDDVSVTVNNNDLIVDLTASNGLVTGDAVEIEVER
ncbi:MAG: hypothetical protein AAGI01_15655, partial [Myxococcota bacterium]